MSQSDWTAALNAVNQSIQQFAGAFATGASTTKAIREARRQQEILMHRTNDVNRANWDVQNAYNSDMMQVSRRKAAGLNPVTVDGMSNAGTMAAATAPPGMAAPGVNWSQAVEGVLDATRVRSEVNLADSQADKNRAEADALRGNTDPSRTEMSLKDSVRSLNRATESLTSARGIGERLRNNITEIDKALRGLDLERATSAFTVRTPGGNETSTPYYLADVLVKAAEVEMALEHSETSRYQRYSAQSRSRIDRMEADTWMQSFRSTMNAIASQIRERNGSAEYREFENSLNRRLADLIQRSRSNKLYYESERDKSLYWRERKGTAELGRTIQSISPFGSTVK